MKAERPRGRRERPGKNRARQINEHLKAGQGIGKSSVRARDSPWSSVAAVAASAVVALEAGGAASVHFLPPSLPAFLPSCWPFLTSPTPRGGAAESCWGDFVQGRWGNLVGENQQQTRPSALAGCSSMTAELCKTSVCHCELATETGPLGKTSQKWLKGFGSHEVVYLHRSKNIS